ncbi:hypothetical protein [Candidatus Synchoanobacter obligatus]|uniref:Lipoprotein n=1 Tax=Candidatus Synchoanobacter obligatus TaxID=2919597 RepID=A0ABT1L3M1_9GAMM|nr:hypothetical protein [Candidatus Synchoanobacter obligatus]MCP8351809.1 hypothetical protein [Candidatus Synchoanobacter obligatus]
MRKIILSLMLITLLAGCGQQYQSARFEYTSFTQQTSVVLINLRPSITELEIVKFANEDGSLINTVTQDGFYTFAYNINRFQQRYFEEEGNYVLLLNPGYYAIKRISVSNGPLHLSSPIFNDAVRIDPLGFNPYLGAFYAPAGKVVYVGDLHMKYHPITKLFRIKHVYHDRAAQRYLQATYPALSRQLTRGPYYEGNYRYQYEYRY